MIPAAQTQSRSKERHPFQGRKVIFGKADETLTPTPRRKLLCYNRAVITCINCRPKSNSGMILLFHVHSLYAALVLRRSGDLANREIWRADQWQKQPSGAKSWHRTEENERTALHPSTPCKSSVGTASNDSKRAASARRNADHREAGRIFACIWGLPRQAPYKLPWTLRAKCRITVSAVVLHLAW